MEIIRKEQLCNALQQSYRQYLTGHLSVPQPSLKHIDDDIEIGMSLYKEFTADTPHVHPVCTEHAYILQGAIRIKLLDGSGEEQEFKAGDFFLLRPGTPYATKNAPGTQVLFIKSPGMNDKTIVETDEETKKWLSAWDTD